MRASVPVSTQVAVILYFLSDGGRITKTANAFGLAACTVLDDHVVILEAGIVK